MANREGSPRDPEAARAQLEQTRARMSDTIDEIEATLLQKKEEIRNRLDVRARIKEKPLHAAGIVLGIGFLVGFLTGGDDDSSAVVVDDHRTALWEARARRLLRIARDQEGEIERLESSLAQLEQRLAEQEEDGYGAWTDDDDEGDDYGYDGHYSSRLSMLGDSVGTHLRSTIGELSRALIDGVRARL